MIARSHSNRSSFALCLFALLAVSFSILIRAETNYFADEIINRSALSLKAFANLMLHYQFSLIGTLVLAGILVDIFRPRYIILLGLIAALIGNLLFAYGTSPQLVVIGRIITGYAHPFILIGALKLGVESLSTRSLAIYIGAVFSIVLLIPQMMQPIVTWLYLHSNYITTLAIINGLGGLVLVVIAGIKASNETTIPRYALGDLLRVLVNFKIWLLCFISIVGWLSNTFLLNWGAQFLKDIYHLTDSHVLQIIHDSFLSFALGALVISFVTAQLKHKPYVISGCYLIAGITYISFAYCSPTQIPYAFYFVAFLTSSAILCYVAAYQYCTVNACGFALGLISCLTTLANTFFAYYMGKKFIRLSLGLITQENFQTWLPAVGFIPAGLLLGGFIALTLRAPTR